MCKYLIDASMLFYSNFFFEGFGNILTIIFIEIINYEGENIVGFTLLDAFYNGGYYASKKIVSIEFPKINGEYQDISLDYVNERINEIKASCSQTLSI